MTLPTLDSPGPTPTPPPPVAAATRLEARSISLPEVSPDAPSVPTRKRMNSCRFVLQNRMTRNISLELYRHCQMHKFGIYRKKSYILSL